jgi:prepilin-type N-terminal cleavage/methylation domain-containing protein
VAGRTSAISRCKNRSRGFSLIEIIVVILIIGILIGVTGTLFSGMVAHFEGADDHTIARRRAQDVFNVMKVPVLNAGLGVPSDNLDWYFELGGAKAPVWDWNGPVSVVSNDSYANVGAGNVLRVVYALESGARSGNDEVTDFSTKLPAGSSAYVRNYVGGGGSVKMKLAAGQAPVIGGMGLLPGGGAGVSLDMRSFITFPGLHKNPVRAVAYDAGTRELSLEGKTPYSASDDILWRNVIHPNSDMRLVRAGVAYVDDESRFCLADLAMDDYPLNGLPRGRSLVNGFVVEGIKAVNFEVSSGRRTVTITVLAEGDNFVSGRRAGASMNGLKNRWPLVNFEDERYYEDFSMTWRTRNLVDSTP